MDTDKAWFITGAFKGLGLILAKKLLAEGFMVAATPRKKEGLITELGGKSVKFLPLEMDLTDDVNVKKRDRDRRFPFRKIRPNCKQCGIWPDGNAGRIDRRRSEKEF